MEVVGKIRRRERPHGEKMTATATVVKQVKVTKLQKAERKVTRKEAQAAIGHLQRLLDDDECGCVVLPGIIVGVKNVAVAMDTVAHAEELWTPANKSAFDDLRGKLWDMLDDEAKKINHTLAFFAFARVAVHAASYLPPTAKENAPAETNKQDARAAIAHLQSMLDDGTHGNSRCSVTRSYIVAAKVLAVTKNIAAHGRSAWTPEGEKAEGELERRLVELLDAESKKDNFELAFQALAMVITDAAHEIERNLSNHAEKAA
jgi:hypothetical protein